MSMMKCKIITGFSSRVERKNKNKLHLVIGLRVSTSVLAREYVCIYKYCQNSTILYIASNNKVRIGCDWLKVGYVSIERIKLE